MFVFGMMSIRSILPMILVMMAKFAVPALAVTLNTNVTDDGNMQIMLGLKWPLRDLNWYLDGVNDTVMAGNQRIKRTSTETYTDQEKLDIIEFSKKTNMADILKVMETDTTIQQETSMVSGEQFLEDKDKLELEIRDAGFAIEKGSPSFKHQLGFGKTDKISTTMARLGTVGTRASRTFMEAMNLKVQSSVGLAFLGRLPGCDSKHSELKRPAIVESCDPNSPYRTADGSCNNVAHTLWGASFTPFRRELAPVYDNGIDTLRKTVRGLTMAGQRWVSREISSAKSEKSQTFSALHMTYGQFVDHDLTATPLSRASNSGFEMSESPIKCCDVEDRLKHPECAEIPLVKNDPFYRTFYLRCMEFVRSAPAERDCLLGPREQTNQQTGYLDGSAIYGNQPSAINELRSHVNGLMKVQLLSDGQTLLPQAVHDEDGECNTPYNIAKGQFCFLAGDERANEQILLTFFHTLWVREHNRVATLLREDNQDWDDEKLFQEAKRIVVAELQQVTFGEYLPTIIGPTLMASSKLNPLNGSHQTTDYDDQIDASIANSFASAAYRFGHSLIPDNLLFTTKYGQSEPKELSTLFFNPFDLYRNEGMSEVARGGLSRAENTMDSFISPEVTTKLFRGSLPHGLDLFALNIQRGRDHGLPTYNDWRVFCGLQRAAVFQDLIGQMSQEAVDRLKKAYTSPLDIDLFAGGISETPLPDALLGHTFTCLIHSQFFRMKYGDRYWFEYRDGPGSFTQAKMRQLHRVTLARIMCNNLPEVDFIQRWPMRNAGPDNPKISCKCIRQYNLDPWKPNYIEVDVLDEDDNANAEEGACN